MKSILLSIKPEWLCKILNQTKTIEVRRLFPKEYVGWVYIYCSKGGFPLFEEENSFRDSGKEYGLYAPKTNIKEKEKYGYKYLNGKVVARFWCDKVEEIVCHNMFNVPTYNTKLLFERQLCIKSCLGVYDLFDYLGDKNGFAIHISKLEIFDKPRELKHFHYYKTFHRNEPDEEGRKTFKALIQLNKAPQNLCYIENID